ncbi:hypothetical protein Tsubulata_031457 [Turnera subulata]|uniref:E3 ubiquitin-protein ligase RMA n=1 Tax=Turnera subulata TaxID=218843 RepID=A0A9Q0JDL3_9ROSI|nr:hypothetical protein Tsubulata_031457 [Turnera subulata]
MAIDQFLEDSNEYLGHNKSSLENWKSLSDALMDSDDSPSSGFDCYICLEPVQDPVVTLCGHLYCWPCIYKWLHYQSISAEDEFLAEPLQQCPVCKAEISETTIVPLFGRGQMTKPSKSKGPNLGIVIPSRPLACGFDSPRTPIASRSARSSSVIHQGGDDMAGSQLYYPQPASMVSLGGSTANMVDPLFGLFGEMINGRVFSNSIENAFDYPNSYQLFGNASPRIRRHVLQADKSLSRICFFLFCCVFLCFLTF